MAIEKRVTVKEVTGKPIGVYLITVDKNITAVRIITDDGAFEVSANTSYSNHLTVVRDYKPERKPCWRVDAKFKDGGTSTRVFSGDSAEADAKYESELLEGKTDCTEVKIVKGTVAVDEDGETIAGSTADDIPF